MTINRLLEELIKISKQTKTDFALHMRMAPSGLSKILTGKTLPSIKERQNFTHQSADYFTKAIYSQGCYLKFENIFPIIYDFSSPEELKEFLVAAIAYALDMDFMVDSKINLDFNDRGMYYLGKKLTENQLCIILSNYAIQFPDESLELFISLPPTDSIFLKISEKIILIGVKKHSKIVLNYCFNSDLINGANRIHAKDLLFLTSSLSKYFDLNFYEVDGDIGFFILLKGQLLLLFNTQIDSSPLLIPISHKSYLSIFYNKLFEKGIKKISYNKDESIKFLTENPQFISDLLEQGIEGVYNFLSLGYFLTQQELAATQNNPVIYDAIFKLFNSILTEKPPFIVSLSAMNSFSTTGNVIAPLIGTISFAPEHRIAYMQRFDNYLSMDHYSQLEIIDSDLTDIAILFSKELCLIYTTDNTCTREKVHIFHSPHLHSQLYRGLAEKDAFITCFSTELWNSYQDRLQHITHEIIRNETAST